MDDVSRLNLLIEELSLKRRVIHQRFQAREHRFHIGFRLSRRPLENEVQARLFRRTRSTARVDVRFVERDHRSHVAVRRWRMRYCK